MHRSKRQSCHRLCHPKCHPKCHIALIITPVVAALQAASRHPALSTIQRDIIVGVAKQITTGLVDVARRRFGVGSAIETTLTMGFEMIHDRPGRA